MFPLLPCFAAPASKSVLDVLIHRRWNEKLGFRRPSVRLLYKFDLFFTQGLAVCGARILTMRRAISNMALYVYYGRLARRPSGIAEGVLDSIKVVGIAHTNHVPSVGQEPPRDVLGERDIRFAFDGDVVVVVDPAQVVELEVTCQRSGLRRDAFHHATVAAQRVDPVPEQLKSRLVVSRCEPFLGDGHPHARGYALPQGAGGRLDA